MTVFKRISPGLTVPELLRQQADRRAIQICRALPAAAWCRSGVIIVASGHGGQRRLFGLEPSRRAAAVPADRPVAWQPWPEPGMVTGLRGAMLQAGTVACFATATGMLVCARFLARFRVLGSDDVVLAFRSAEWLTGVGMRLWHARWTA